jgi:hypothetical protein
MRARVCARRSSGAPPPAAELGSDVDDFGDSACVEPGIVVSEDVTLDAPEREALNRLARSRDTPLARARTLTAPPQMRLALHPPDASSLHVCAPVQVCLGHHYRALERFAHAELAAPPDAPGASLCAPRACTPV